MNLSNNLISIILITIFSMVPATNDVNLINVWLGSENAEHQIIFPSHKNILLIDNKNYDDIPRVDVN